MLRLLHMAEDLREVQPAAAVCIREGDLRAMDMKGIVHGRD